MCFPVTITGARRTDLYINECNNVTFDAYHQLAIRTSGQIWLDYNPVAPFWVDRELITQENVDFIQLTYKDNEALSETIVSEIESAKHKAKTSSYWANWWEVYGLGNIGSLEGVCIPDWRDIDKLPEEARLLCYGLDFGYSNDPSSLIAIYKYNEAYIFDEVIYQTKLLNADISDLLKTYEVKEIIYADRDWETIT